MEIEWEAQDGYVTGSRPHTTEVDDEEILACGTEEAVEELIQEFVQEDFNQTVAPGVEESDIQKAIDFWREKSENTTHTQDAESI